MDNKEKIPVGMKTIEKGAALFVGQYVFMASEKSTGENVIYVEGGGHIIRTGTYIENNR